MSRDEWGSGGDFGPGYESELDQPEEDEPSVEAIIALERSKDENGEYPVEAIIAFEKSKKKPERPGRLERQLGFIAQLPTLGLADDPDHTRLGDSWPWAREKYNQASSTPWQTAQEAANDPVDPDAAMRRRETFPEAAVDAPMQGIGALARLPFSVIQSSKADEALLRAVNGDFEKHPPAHLSYILQSEFPEYVPPEDEGDEAAVKAAAERVYANKDRRMRADYPVIDRAVTAAKAVPGMAVDTVGDSVKLFGGVMGGDPGKVNEGAGAVGDFLGAGLGLRGAKAIQKTALTANASDAANAAARKMRHDAPAEAFDQLEGLADAKRPTKRYPLAPVSVADDLVAGEDIVGGVSDLPGPPARALDPDAPEIPLDVSDLPGPPVTFDMVQAAIERDMFKQSSDFPGGVRVPDALKPESSAYLTDDLTPGARPSNLRNLPPKPSIPPGDFMADLPARRVDEADIIPGRSQRVRKRDIVSSQPAENFNILRRPTPLDDSDILIDDVQGPLLDPTRNPTAWMRRDSARPGEFPAIPERAAERKGFSPAIISAGKQMGGPVAELAAKFERFVHMHGMRKVRPDQYETMLRNPEWALENFDTIISKSDNADELDAFLSRLPKPAEQYGPTSAPAWRNTGRNKSLVPEVELPSDFEKQGYLGRLYEAARAIGGPQKAVVDVISDPSFREFADNKAWTPQKIRSVVANPELLRNDGDFLSALTLRNRDHIVENFVKSNGRRAEDIAEGGHGFMFTAKSSGLNPGIQTIKKAKGDRGWIKIPDSDTRFPASTRGMWLRRADYSRLDQIMGGRNSYIAKLESVIKKNLVLRNPKSHVYAGIDDTIVQTMDGGAPDSIVRAIRALNGKGDSLDKILAPEFMKRYMLGDYISEDLIGAGVAPGARVAAMKAVREGKLKYLEDIISSKHIRDAREAALSASKEIESPVTGAYRNTAGRMFDSYDAAAQALWMLRDYGHRYAFFKREIERALNFEKNGTHRFRAEDARSLAAKIREGNLLDEAAKVADFRGFDYQNLPQFAMGIKAIGLEPFASFKFSSSAAFYDWAARNPVKFGLINVILRSGLSVREREMAVQQAERRNRNGGWIDTTADVARGAGIGIPRITPTATVGVAESPLPSLEDIGRGRVGLVGRAFDVKHVLWDGVYPDGRPVTDPRLPAAEQYLNRAVIALEMSGFAHTQAVFIANMAVEPEKDEPGSGRTDFQDPLDPFGSPDSRVREEAITAANALRRLYQGSKYAPSRIPSKQGQQIAEAREKQKAFSRDQRTTSSRAE